jgi:hypothetical protein
MRVVIAAVLFLAQDPADQLRRQELALRIEELASSGKLEGAARAVQRELRGRHVDAAAVELCWKLLAGRRWDGKLEDFVAAWDKSAAVEAATPGAALFRARLETLLSRPKAQRDLLEAASKTFPAEPALLWTLAKARFDAGDSAGAASALEELAPLRGFSYDADEFHRLLAQAYAKTERRGAALEHLRAMRQDPADAVELATLAQRCRLPEEAARQFRTAVEANPERMSLRMGLIRALQDSGAEAEARAERRAMVTIDGEVSAGKVEDYFFLLPAEGRVDEMTRILSDLASAGEKIFDAAASKVPPDDRGRVAEAWEKSIADPRGWAMLVRLKCSWGGATQPALESIEKAEKLFPQEPLLVREKISLMERLSRPEGVSAAFQRLAELDPERKSGPRPYGAAQWAMRQLAPTDAAEALRLGVLILSEPKLDPATFQATRAAMKPACELAGASFWDEVRKLKLPAADAKVVEAARGHLSRLSDDEFEVRSGAARGLRKLGLPVIPTLLEHIDDTDVDLRSRVREIIRAILSE